MSEPNADKVNESIRKMFNEIHAPVKVEGPVMTNGLAELIDWQREQCIAIIRKDKQRQALDELARIIRENGGYDDDFNNPLIEGEN